MFKWGLIGPGRIAHAFARALDVVDDAELYAVASRSPKRGADFASRYGASSVYETYAALMADPNVDAVYVATPHRFHAEQAAACIEAGKPVLCEKPLVVNAAEFERLAALARARSVFLMEALWTRFLPVFSQVRSWLDAGAIGDVRLMSSTFGFKPAFDPVGRLFNPDLAGGALLDIGVYNVAVSLWLMGAEPAAVEAAGRLGATGVDEQVSAVMQFRDGAVSQFTCSLQAELGNEFTIYGTEGRIHLHPRFWQCTQATLRKGGDEVTVSRPFEATGFEYEIRDAMACIRSGLVESPAMPHADTLANLEVMDRIRQRVGLRYPFEEA